MIQEKIIRFFETSINLVFFSKAQITEKAVISELLSGDSLVLNTVIREQIHPEHFRDQRLGVIFRSITLLHNQDENITLEKVWHSIKQERDCQVIHRRLLTRLSKFNRHRRIDLDFELSQMKEIYRKTQCQRLGKELISKKLYRDMGTIAILDKIEGRAYELIRLTIKDPGFIGISSVLDHLEKKFEKYFPFHFLVTDERKIQSGIASIDGSNNGILPGEVLLVAGPDQRDNYGMLMQLILTLGGKKRLAILLADTSIHTLALDLAIRESKIKYTKGSWSEISPAQKLKIGNAARELNDLNVSVLEIGNYTLTELKHRCLQHIVSGGCDFLILFQLEDAIKEQRNFTESYLEMLRIAKRIAYLTNIPYLIFSTNRLISNTKSSRFKDFSFDIIANGGVDRIVVTDNAVNEKD